MNIIQAIVSGIVQGLTEFLPISSSGHLVLLHKLFGFTEPQMAFDIFLHIGTLISVLAFFAKDIIYILTKNRKMIALLLAACVPTFAIGILFKDAAEGFFGSALTVGYMLMVTGIWLVLAHLSAGKKKKTHPVSWFDSLVIGLAQGIAIIPGISRSGATIGAGLVAGLDRTEAVRFSFLLSVPAILGASAVKFAYIGESVTGSSLIPFLAGGMAALLTGMAAIYLLLKAVKASKLWAFGVYCLLAGSTTILLSR